MNTMNTNNEIRSYVIRLNKVIILFRAIITAIQVFPVKIIKTIK